MSCSSPIDIKTPLTYEMNSCSGSSDSSEYQTTGTPFLMDNNIKMENHDYASPEELRNQLKVDFDKSEGIKKRNLLYEPLSLPPRNKQFHDKHKIIGEEQLSQVHHNEKLYRFLFVIIFLFSLGAFILSVLSSFGFITTSNCVCKTEPSTSSNKYSSTKPTEHTVDPEHLHQLERNITMLTQNVIPKLFDQIKQLKEELNTKVTDGKPGPAGPQGIQGPAGAGDLSKCRYKTDITSSSFKKDSPDKESVKTSWQKATQGYIILGASCTTEGGLQKGLYQENIVGEPRYQCRCAGKTTIELFVATSLICQINYWECPIKS